MLKYFPFNMHFVDRIARVVLGVVMMAYPYWGIFTPLTTDVHPYWGLLGIYPLVTGAWGYDPIFHLLGLNFRKKKLTFMEWDLAKAARDEQAAQRLEDLKV